jgi:hypothetical protein
MGAQGWGKNREKFVIRIFFCYNILSAFEGANRKPLIQSREAGKEIKPSVD